MRPYDGLKAALVPVHISARRTLSPNFGAGLQGRCDSKMLEAACLDEARPYDGGMLQRTSRQLSSLGNNNPTIVQTWPRWTRLPRAPHDDLKRRRQGPCQREPLEDNDATAPPHLTVTKSGERLPAALGGEQAALQFCVFPSRSCASCAQN